MNRNNNAITSTRPGIERNMFESQADYEQAVEWGKRHDVTPRAFKSAKIDDGNIREDVSRGECHAWASRCAATGSVDCEFSGGILARAINATKQHHQDAVSCSDFVTAAMTGLGPQNELEAMLAAQMVAINNQTLDCLRRANIKDQVLETKKLYLTFADRFARTFTAQVDALSKLRRPAEQKVVVEHVHVYQGGQAVVGVVTPGEEGATHEKGKTTRCLQAVEQSAPAVPVRLEDGETLLCEVQTDRETLPAAGDGER